MHYQYISICRGGQSIIEKLKAANIDPHEYIRFYSLRSYDRIHRRKLEEMMVRAAGYSANDEPSMEEQVASTEITEGGNDIPVSVKRSKEVFNAEECIAKDIISDNAMQGGDIKREPWLVDTPTSQPRDADAEKIERDGYVSEECYIHAKLLIADGKWRKYVWDAKYSDINMYLQTRSSLWALPTSTIVLNAATETLKLHWLSKTKKRSHPRWTDIM